MDPPFTRIIKIDILTSLALEPAAIEAVLNELRTYIRFNDKVFVCAAIRAVGKVAELARIVYDRHGLKSGDTAKERKTANRIALDCLYGLSVVTQSSDSKSVVGESVIVMQSILSMLISDAGEAGGLMSVEDSNDVQGFALRRTILLLVNGLSARIQQLDEGGDDGSDKGEKEETELEKISIDLLPGAIASALWLVGEWISSLAVSPVTLHDIDGNARSKMRVEIARLLDRAFPDLEPEEKEQGVHFASKLLISSAAGAAAASSVENSVCEHILSMGRVDVNPDVRDRARYESGIVHATIGLKYDKDATEGESSIRQELTIENAKRIFLATKPAPSYIQVEEAHSSQKDFRFGTLSSLVGHKARGAYIQLPPWSAKNSPKALRDPVEVIKEQLGSDWKTQQNKASGPGFYEGSGSADSDSSDNSAESSTESSSSKSSRGDDSDDEDSSDDSSSSSDGSSDNNLMMPTVTQNQTIIPILNGGTGAFGASNPIQPMGVQQPIPPFQNILSSAKSSDDERSDDSDDDSSSSSSSDDDDSSSGSSSDQQIGMAAPMEGVLLSMGGGMQPQMNSFAPTLGTVNNGSSSAMDDLRGLVMTPIDVAESGLADPNLETDSGTWIQLVRPEHCGGLSVKARYLRGPSRAREARLKGLDSDCSSLVCLQVQFENK
jgi:AP-3 complex subunit beta